MDASRHKNLIPDSPAHRQLEALLREQGGRAPVTLICEQVLKLSPVDAVLGRQLVSALIGEDTRMQLDGNGCVEWAGAPPELSWTQCRRFAVIDLETTNGTRNDQRVIEVGICQVEDGRLISEWHSLVNPERSIPYWVRQLTGITDAAVQRAPRFEEVLPNLLDLLQDAVLVAHHARFDVACLNAELSRLWGKRLANPYLCTVELARRFLPGSENYRLETLSRWLGLTHTRPHRAHSDARATAELFCHLLRSAPVSWTEFLRPRPPRETEQAGEDALSAQNPETNPPPAS